LSSEYHRVTSLSSESQSQKKRSSPKFLSLILANILAFKSKITLLLKDAYLSAFFLLDQSMFVFGLILTYADDDMLRYHFVFDLTKVEASKRYTSIYLHIAVPHH